MGIEVLIVESIDKNINAAKEWANKNDIQIDIAKTYDAAKEFIDNKKYDAAICSIYIRKDSTRKPEDLCGKLSELANSVNLNVIFLTSDKLHPTRFSHILTADDYQLNKGMDARSTVEKSNSSAWAAAYTMIKEIHYKKAA